MEGKLSSDLPYSPELQAKDSHAQYNEPTLPAIPQASLLGLPSEVRLQIFGFLLPDIGRIPYREPNLDEPVVDPWKQRLWTTKCSRVRPQIPQTLSDVSTCLQDYLPIRRDLQSCHPNILRVNQQIYDECVPLVYQNNTFEVTLGPRDLRFCSHLLLNPYGATAEDTEPLHLSSRHMKALTIFLEAPTRSAIYWRHRDHMEHKFHVSKLVALLRKCTCLRIIHFVIRPSSFYNEFTPVGNGVEQKDVEAHATELLDRFCSIRHLETVKVTIEGFRHDDQARNLPLREVDYSPFFASYLDKFVLLICGQDPTEEKAPEIVLFAKYLVTYELMFSSNLTSFIPPRIDAGRWIEEVVELWERAWRACEFTDIGSFRDVIEDTKMKWAAVQEEWEKVNRTISSNIEGLNGYIEDQKLKE